VLRGLKGYPGLPSTIEVYTVFCEFQSMLPVGYNVCDGEKWGEKGRTE